MTPKSRSDSTTAPSETTGNVPLGAIEDPETSTAARRSFIRASSCLVRSFFDAVSLCNSVLPGCAVHRLPLARRRLGAETVPVASDIIRQQTRVALILLGHKFEDGLAPFCATRGLELLLPVSVKLIPSGEMNSG